MKLSDNNLKKAFKHEKIPEPSETAKKIAILQAVEALGEKSVSAEKNVQGFSGLLRHMGESFRNILRSEGDPIMTRTSVATISIAAIAIGVFLTIGTTMYLSRFTVLEEKIEAPLESEKVAPSRDKAAPSKAFPAPPMDEAKQRQYASKAKPSARGPAYGSKSGIMRQRQAAPLSHGSYTEGDIKASLPAERMMGAAPMAEPGFLRKERPAFERPDVGLVDQYKDVGRDQFKDVKPNPVKIVAEQPVSTFSIDVDTASYTFVRRQLNSGVLPQKNAVRIEEMINYFDYDYTLPKDKTKPFQPTVAVYPTPWNSKTKILHVGIKGYDIVPEKKPRSNLVFLIDVSGSMNSPDKLPLLKNSFSLLVDALSPEDTVGIIVYAGAAGTVLEPTKVKEKGKILASLGRLQAGGSTAGGEGIRLAYSLAEMNFDKDAVNRVILATDGDFNVGITNRAELKSYIERKRKTKIFLSVLGFGQGNYNDALMQDLAQNGNGTAAYIDNLNEARKVLVDEANSTLFIIAKDVKIQVEFNPDKVHDYRLIGYETRMLRREDFKNDQVDAGDVGSGHSVTAIYEITPVESMEKLVDPLRYQPQKKKIEKVSSEYAFVKIRYKLPDAETSNLITKPVGSNLEYDTLSKTPPDMRFAISVAAFGQILRNNPYTRKFNYDDVLKLAEPARGRDSFGYRSEFLNLVRLAKSARGM